MIKNLLLISLTMFLTTLSFAQTRTNDISTFYINVFINSDKQIFVESDKTDFSKVTNEIKGIIDKHQFKIDEQIIFRLFADENLEMGFISDVNRQMNNANSDKLQTQRYLLNTVQLNIDGKNWFESKKIKEQIRN